MGMSAAQAKLLSLTARRSDINYQLSSLMRGKLDLMTQASNAADMLADSKRNNNIFVLTTSDNQQTELSFNSLSKEGLTIVDAKGRTIVPSSYKTNPKGLTSILPASHPSVKSYDGDFVVKDKLNKNYVSIPQNQIPIFDNSKDFQQKYVKVSSDEPTVTSKFVEQNSIYSGLKNFSTNSVNAVDTLFDYMNNNYKDYYMVVGKQGNYNDWFTDNNTIDENKAKAFTFEKLTGKDTFATEFNKLFASELGKDSGYVSDLNKSLGCDGYTAYNKRQFQYDVSIEQSQILMENKVGIDKMDTVSYVSNAEQLITALLKDATIEGGKLESNANIMLLNDIDLDDMLQDDNNGKKGLKGFIQDEISSLSLENASEEQKTAYKNAIDNFTKLTQVNTVESESNSNDNIKSNLTLNLSNMLYNLATAYGINSIGTTFNSDVNKNIANSDSKGLNSDCVINKLAALTIDDNMDERQKQLINMAKDTQTILGITHSNIINIGLEDLATILQTAALSVASVTTGNAKTTSGIDASVLANIYSKYFSSGTNDNFNEDFTNFIQIDKFKGSIGGGGFAINNLKMDAKNGQFAGMFGEVQDAFLDGIWMENAQVLSSGNSDANTHNAAILTKTLSGNSFVNVSARGQQFTIDDRGDNKNNNFDTATFLHLCYENKNNMQYNDNWFTNTSERTNRSKNVNAGWSIIDMDTRTDDNIKTAIKTRGSNYSYSKYKFKDGLDDGYVDCGYAFKSYNNYTGRNSNSAHTGWRTVAADVEDHDKDKRLFSETSGNNVSDGFAGDEYDTYYDNSLNGLTVRYNNKRIANLAGNGSVSALDIIFANAGKTNSKIKIYKKEDVNSYEAPDIEGSWKENAKFDDGTEINWNDWEVIDGSFNSETGEYALVKKHGEETEEYLSVMSLLEFYKEQGVNIDINEDRESGFLTYSAYGYSVDVEYKDDLEKYNSDPYLYKVENNDSSLLIYERDKVNDVDISQLVFVDDIEALLDKNIKNGVWFIQGASVSDATKFERKSLDEIGISETTDENADNIAQAEYERKMRDIELQEEKFDAQITELENTLKGIEQEIENQQKIVKQNIQSSFSTFAS